jgi:membrane protein DedA with SNARE-associated domain
LESILHWVSTYGYAAIFSLLVLGIVGVPVPDEWLLVFTGYLVFKGRFHPALAIATAFAGSACGITCSYLIGRTLGLGAIHRYGRWFHVREEHVQRVHDWFGRAGHWVLFFGYFIPGVRHLSALVAGTSKLEPRIFAAWAWSGAFTWVCTFICIGWALGEQWERVFHVIDRNIRVVSIIAGVLLALWLLYKYWWQRRRRTNP